MLGHIDNLCINVNKWLSLLVRYRVKYKHFLSVMDGLFNLKIFADTRFLAPKGVNSLLCDVFIFIKPETIYN
jgi:hypothetical protein